MQSTIEKQARGRVLNLVARPGSELERTLVSARRLLTAHKTDNHPLSELPLGVVWFGGGEPVVSGYTRLSDDGSCPGSEPSGWEPGVIAFELASERAWVALGGNNYDGAERWVPIRTFRVDGGAA